MQKDNRPGDFGRPLRALSNYKKFKVEELESLMT